MESVREWLDRLPTHGSQLAPTSRGGRLWGNYQDAEQRANAARRRVEALHDEEALLSGRLSRARRADTSAEDFARDKALLELVQRDVEECEAAFSRLGRSAADARKFFNEEFAEYTHLKTLWREGRTDPNYEADWRRSIERFIGPQTSGHTRT